MTRLIVCTLALALICLCMIVLLSQRNHREVFKLTAYTWTGNRTASGKIPKVGYIAVDPKVISLGRKVTISGLGSYVAEDTGKKIKGKHIDIYMNSREEALNFGVQYREIIYD